MEDENASPTVLFWREVLSPLSLFVKQLTKFLFTLVQWTIGQAKIFREKSAKPHGRNWVKMWVHTNFESSRSNSYQGSEGQDIVAYQLWHLNLRSPGGVVKIITRALKTGVPTRFYTLFPPWSFALFSPKILARPSGQAIVHLSL